MPVVFTCSHCSDCIDNYKAFDIKCHVCQQNGRKFCDHYNTIGTHGECDSCCRQDPVSGDKLNLNFKRDYEMFSNASDHEKLVIIYNIKNYAHRGVKQHWSRVINQVFSEKLNFKYF